VSRYISTMDKKTNDRLNSAVSANLAVLEKLQGLWMARAIHVAVRLGLPDLLEKGAKRLAELASAGHCQEPTLRRLLCCLKHLGIVAELWPEFYSGTPLCEQLRPNRADSLYWLSMVYGEEWQLRAWERLEDSIRTGRSGMSNAFGTDLWSYLDQHPDSAELYNNALTGLSALNEQIAKAYDFPEKAVVVDVGGGQGDFLRRLLAINATIRGILFDRKSVIDSVEIAGDPLCGDRVSLTAGDFFESIPSNGDIYIRKQVLHDWDDLRALAILGTCRTAMKTGAKLLIVELVLPEEGPNALFVALLDLHMLVVHGGRERTEAEFAKLLLDSGYQLQHVIGTPTPASIIEAEAA
jgi:hypothetical protein